MSKQYRAADVSVPTSHLQPCHDIHLADNGGALVETEDNVRKRYTAIFNKVSNVLHGVNIKQFVFSHGFDGDGGLGMELNQSSVDFILWLTRDFHDLLHIFRCGVDGRDQVERMSELAHNTFFKDIVDYVGNKPFLLESLPTADTCDNPKGEVSYLRSSGKFPDSKAGFVGAVEKDSGMTYPRNLPPPNVTIHGDPMSVMKFTSVEDSYREAIEYLLQTGCDAYSDVMDRMGIPKKKKTYPKIGNVAFPLSTKFENPDYQTNDQQINRFKSFDELVPHKDCKNPLLFCIFEACKYFFTTDTFRVFYSTQLFDPLILNNMESFGKFLGNSVSSFWIGDPRPNLDAIQNPKERENALNDWQRRNKLEWGFYRSNAVKFFDWFFDKEKGIDSNQLIKHIEARFLDKNASYQVEDMHFLAVYFI
jgi:hypothetical protein